MMTLANEELARGKSPAEAVRVARERLFDRTEGHPSYFMTLRVWGLGHEPVFSREEVSELGAPRGHLDIRIVLSGAIVALFVGFLVLRRRRRALD